MAAVCGACHRPINASQAKKMVTEYVYPDGSTDWAALTERKEAKPDPGRRLRRTLHAKCFYGARHRATREQLPDLQTRTADDDVGVTTQVLREQEAARRAEWIALGRRLDGEDRERPIPEAARDVTAHLDL